MFNDDLILKTCLNNLITDQQIKDSYLIKLIIASYYKLDHH